MAFILALIYFLLCILNTRMKVLHLVLMRDVKDQRMSERLEKSQKGYKLL